MKLATYLHQNRVSCGIITDNGIIDIPTHTRDKICYHSIKEILIRGKEAMERVTELAETANDYLSFEQVRLMAPVPRPGKVIGLAGNYVKHIEELNGPAEVAQSPAATTVPRPFIMPSTVVTSTNSRIPWPSCSEQIDYEIELAIMIGRPAKCVQVAEASEYIAGYTIANDISARSVTFSAGRRERPRDEFFDWLCGKWGDGFLPLGPWMVTADEIQQPQNLQMELTVNGQVRQKACTSQMIFDVTQIVSFLSHLMTLEPGDCIATGTPAGVGASTGQYLQAGDRIECTIEGIGTLSNIMDEPPTEYYTPLKN